MKKNIILITIITSTVLCSCSRVIQPELSTSEVIFKASIEPNASLSTRTCMGENGAILWSPAEEIGVFIDNGYVETFVSQNTEPARTVDFKGFLEGMVDELPSGKYVWAVYPFNYTQINGESNTVRVCLPYIQTAEPGTFDPCCYPTMARSSTTNLIFYAICGGIRFSVKREGIHTISIMGNKKEKLAGIISATIGDDGKPKISRLYNEQKMVVINAPEGTTFQPGVYYYITMVPVELKKGISITFYSDTEKGTYISNNPQTVKRSVFGTIENIDEKVSNWESIAEPLPEPEAVDLGLSVKWASFNLGASKPEESGDYYAWGETTPHYLPGSGQSNYPVWKTGMENGYNWTNYKWCNGNQNSITKYNLNAYYGTVDNITVLDLEDDAARVNLGGLWRMPTFNELEELEKNCTSEWVTENGVNGRRITSLIDGYTDKSIFIPAAGYRGINFDYSSGSFGYYWSSSINHTNCSYSYYLLIDPGIPRRMFQSRAIGRSIRPVYGEFIPVSSIDFKDKNPVFKSNETVQPNVIILPENASAKDIHLESSDISVVDFDYEGNIKTRSAGTATITAYASNGISATCNVTVESR